MDRGRPARIWARFARWLLALLLPLAVTGLLFWDRVDGLVERFMLFQTYDFGWPIPAFGPEGWLGLVQGGDLAPWWWPLRWLLAVMMMSLWSWAIWRSFRRGRRQGWIVVAVTLPILLGYGYLELRGVLRGTNASYDAFKLFAVFYPVLLPAFCWWENLRWAPRLVEYLLVIGFATIVVGFNLLACIMSIWALSRPTFLVDGELRQLRKVEAMTDVASVNLLVPDMWSRLWANVFLLRKPQYFPTHTYEGRLNTPLRGEWDLVSGPVRIDTGNGTRELTTNRWLSDTRAPGFIRAELGAGWHPEEHGRGGDRWTWTLGEARVQLSNPGNQPITVAVQLDGRAFTAQDVSITLQADAPRWTPVGADRAQYRFPSVTIPPGRSTLVLRCRNGASAPEGEARELGVCVFRLTLTAGR